MLKQLTRAIALAAVLMFPALGYAAPILSAGSATVNVGDTFKVPISVFGATNLMAFQFDLSYNSTILTALSFTDLGSDFDLATTEGGGALTGISGFFFPGLLSGVADSMSGASAGLTGNGVIAQIEFKALASGISPLTLSNVFLDFSDAGFSAVNGQVCVNGANASGDGSTVPGGQVPEPSTLALLSLGWGVLRLRRRATQHAIPREEG